MSPAESKALSKIVKQAWKSLATADQNDSEEVKAVLIEALEAIDAMEEGVEIPTE